MGETPWRLTNDVVLPCGMLVFHVRTFAAGPAATPVVIVGEFSDHFGQSLTNAIEDAAAAIQDALYPDGTRFRLVQHRTQRAHGIRYPAFDEVEFLRRRHLGGLRRRLQRRRNERAARYRAAVTTVGPDGVSRHVFPPPIVHAWQWMFYGPNWQHDLELDWPADEHDALYPTPDAAGAELIRPATVRIPALLGDFPVPVWPHDLYTAELVGGPIGAQLAVERAEAERRRAEAENACVDALISPPQGGFVELHGVPAPVAEDPDPEQGWAPRSG
jgi:hypothetical protein